jgi:hypothetical protein
MPCGLGPHYACRFSLYRAPRGKAICHHIGGDNQYMNGLRIIINGMNGFTEDQAKRYDEICRKVEIVVNSVEFRTEVITRRYTSNRDMSSLRIYELIMNGAEILSPTPDHEIDVMVEMYSRNNSTIGYTTPKDEWTHLNNKFYSKLSDAEIGANLIHEWLHKLGFDHSSAKEYTSVPYSIGSIVRDLIKDMEEGRLFRNVHFEEGELSIPVQHKSYVCKRSWKTLFKKVCYYA